MNTHQTMQKPLLWRLRSGERRFILLMGDLFVTIISLAIALVFWAQDDWLKISVQFIRERIPFWYYLLPLLWILLLIELYDVRRASRLADTLRGLAIAASISLGLYLLVFFISPAGSLPRLGVAAFIVAASVLTLAWRVLYINIFTAPLLMRRVLIVGAGNAGSTLAKIVGGMWPPPFYLVGFIDDDPKKRNKKIQDYPVLGGSKELLAVIQERNITDLIFAITADLKAEMFRALIQAEEQGVEVTTMPIIYEELLGRVPIFLLRSDWIIRSFVDHAHTGEFYELVKRLLDIIGGVVGTLVLIILYPLIVLLILVDSGFPLLYRQNRLGKNGKEYPIIKFRTMYADAEKDGKARLATENDERITRVGHFLRRSHLDELPQFINILRGEMSLVGPRAERSELVAELQSQVPFYRARLLVKPGLTGWAQVNFGYASTVADTGVKLEYDLYYIKHRNLLLDLTILMRTVGAVLGLRGR